jgi:LysR family transcriptional regulator, glycine cleavage system transcriptional activator
MDLRQLPALNALRVFEAAARHGSFSRAADELFVTHGAVSHQVRALEAELGAALFTRHGKRLTLTQAGDRYAQQIRTALLLLADATRDVRANDREQRLIVSTMTSFSARWLTPRIGPFIERYPDINFELQSSNTLVDFARDDVDAVIRFGDGRYPGLHVERLLEEVFFPVCAPTLNGGVLPSTPSDLPRYPLLRSDDELWRPWFDAAGLDRLTEPRRGVLYQDSSNLLQAAINGQGIALVRRSLAFEDLALGRIVRLFEIDGPSPWDYYFVCPEPMLKRAQVQAFRGWLLEEMVRFKAQWAELDARRAAEAAARRQA